MDFQSSGLANKGTVRGNFGANIRTSMHGVQRGLKGAGDGQSKPAILDAASIGVDAFAAKHPGLARDYAFLRQPTQRQQWMQGVRDAVRRDPAFLDSLGLTDGEKRAVRGLLVKAGVIQDPSRGMMGRLMDRVGEGFWDMIGGVDWGRHRAGGQLQELVGVEEPVPGVDDADGKRIAGDVLKRLATRGELVASESAMHQRRLLASQQLVDSVGESGPHDAVLRAKSYTRTVQDSVSLREHVPPTFFGRSGSSDVFVGGQEQLIDNIPDAVFSPPTYDFGWRINLMVENMLNRNPSITSPTVFALDNVFFVSWKSYKEGLTTINIEKYNLTTINIEKYKEIDYRLSSMQLSFSVNIPGNRVKYSIAAVDNSVVVVFANGEGSIDIKQLSSSFKTLGEGTISAHPIGDVSSLAIRSDGKAFNVYWKGDDDSDGCYVKEYQVYQPTLYFPDHNGNIGDVLIDFKDEYTYKMISGEGDRDNLFFRIDNNKLIFNAPFHYMSSSESTLSIRVQITDADGVSVEKAIVFPRWVEPEAPPVPGSKKISVDAIAGIATGGSVVFIIVIGIITRLLKYFSRPSANREGESVSQANIEMSRRPQSLNENVIQGMGLQDGRNSQWVRRAIPIPFLSAPQGNFDENGGYPQENFEPGAPSAPDLAAISEGDSPAAQGNVDENSAGARGDVDENGVADQESRAVVAEAGAPSAIELAAVSEEDSPVARENNQVNEENGAADRGNSDD